MGGAVDAASKARNDDEVVLAEIMRETAREAAGSGGRIPRADNRHGLPVEQVEVALCDQEWRCVLELRQRSRIQALPEREEPSTSLSTRAISRSASSRDRKSGALPPPRRARSGTAASAAEGVPKRMMSWRKVTGPMPGVRNNRSRSTKSSITLSPSQCVARCLDGGG